MSKMIGPSEMQSSVAGLVSVDPYATVDTMTCCAAAGRLVSVVFNVPQAALLARTRGKAEAAFARQVAMYLPHIVFNKSLSDIAIVFHRDRTTVAHACRLVEDKRDDKETDKLICTMEWSLRHSIEPLPPGFRGV